MNYAFLHYRNKGKGIPPLMGMRLQITPLREAHSCLAQLLGVPIAAAHRGVVCCLLAVVSQVLNNKQNEGFRSVIVPATDRDKDTWSTTHQLAHKSRTA